MATIAGNVLVQVGGDTSPLRKDLKKASSSLEKFGGKVRTSANSMAKWGVAAASAAAVAATAMVKGAASSAKELDNLSRVARLSNQEFQKYAFAAKSVGIEQDKLADIIKDSNDKMGDFLVTGAGPLADFFEQVAPKIGVTADQFKNLSGPQVLQKYVDGLEKANLSQAEMTFFMEAIASDATALLPLLRDGGKAMKEQAKEAENLGLVLSDIDVQILKDTQDSFEAGAQAVKVLTQRIAVQLAPVITVISRKLKAIGKDSVGVANISTKAFEAIAKAIGFVGNTIRGLQAVIKGLQLAFDTIKLGAITVIKAIVASFNWMDNQVRHVINELIDGVNMLPGIELDRLVTGENAATAKMKEWQQEAAASMHETVGEMHELLKKPMPSDTITNFMAEVNQAAREAAEVVVEARNDALSINALPPETATKTITDLSSMKNAYVEYAQTVMESNRQIAEAEARNLANRQTMMGETSKAFGNLSTLMSSENKKQFELGKKAAKAQAVVDTYASAQASYKALAGIPVIGPGLGIAAAGAAVVAGFSRVRAINSTTFGGGGSSPAAGGGGGSVSAPAQPQQQQQNGTLTVQGIDQGKFYSGDSVAEMAAALVAYQEDGGKVVVV